MPNPHSSYLFCFDFDLTITREHLHHYTQSQILSHIPRDKACLRALQRLASEGVKNAELLWACIYDILLKGHGLAITSFTAFPELPLAFLSKGIRDLRQLSSSKEYDHYLHRPVVVYGPASRQLLPPHKIAHTYYIDLPPQEVQRYGKCKHIDKAQQVLATKGLTFEQIVLIDDDEHNIELAKQAGWIGIHVDTNDSEPTYLSSIKSLLHPPSPL